MRLVILFTFIALTFIALFLSASGQTTQMPPKVIQYTQLPLNLEGYTVNIDARGQMSLYSSHSNQPARNIYSRGGNRIEIESFQRIANFQPGRTPQDQIRELTEFARVSQHGLVKGELYKLTLKIGLGGDFDNRSRRPTNIQAPVSQVVMHWPEQIRLISDPIIKVDGVTQSQQMVSNLLNMASIGLTPGASHLAVSLKSFIVKAIDKAVVDNVLSASFSTYRPSEIFEIYDGINFRGRSMQELTWVLGGHRGRDISTAKSAEITLYFQFEETGDFDMSFFFNTWGTHSYTPSSPVTMHLRDIVLHSFRQHVVVKTQVVEQQDHQSGQSTFTDPRDRQSYMTVTIGNQTWMAENLNIGTMINSRTNQTNNGVFEKYCLENKESNCRLYGGLYQWNEMMQYTTNEINQGICPPGWRIPRQSDWDVLANNLGGAMTAGGKLKSTRTDPDPHPRWNAPNATSSEIAGFNALPTGTRSIQGNVLAQLNVAYWWTSSQISENEAFVQFVTNSTRTFAPGGVNKQMGFGVRCIKR